MIVLKELISMTNSTATKPTVIHSTFQLERKLKASPDRVFAAFSDEATKRRWFYGDGTHALEEHKLEGAARVQAISSGRRDAVGG